MDFVCDMHVPSSCCLADLATSTSSSPFLPLLDTTWRAHCDHMLTLRSIYLYLDRTYVIQSSVRSLWEMGLGLYGGEWKSE